MNIFLTGATGYVGSAVAQSLQDARHKVAGLARTAQAAAKLRAANIDPVEGDLSNPESLAAPSRAADAVIHTAMAWGPASGALDQEAVQVMLDALAGSNKPFLYTSGTWVMGDTRGRVVGEMFPLRPASLVAWRPAVEKLTLDAVQRNIKAAVIRPPRVYGRAGGPIAEMVRQAREKGVVRYVGNGENHWSLVHIDALAELFRLAVEQEPAGEVLLACDGPAFQVKTIAEAAAWTGGAQGRVESWPLEEARAALGPLADALVMDQRIMSTKAGRMLGWDVRRPNVLEDLMRGSYAGAV